MDYYGHHSAALAGLQARLATQCPSISWNGRDVPIIPGSAMRRADLSAGGFQLNADFRFAAHVADFGAEYEGQPSQLKSDLLQSALAYLGDNYKADAVTLHPGGLIVTVDCNSLVQNA